MGKAKKLTELLTEKESSIHKQLVDAGVPIDSHESDLYAKVTPESTKIVNTYVHKKNVTQFKSEVDGEMWYDIPFAYEPFWDKKPVGSLGGFRGKKEGVR